MNNCDMMGRQWQIGDPVDYTTDGWMDAQNWGHQQEDDSQNRDLGRDSPDSRADEYAKKAWDYYMDYKESDALYYINKALDLDNLHAGNWNIKAIILEGMKNYAGSEKCYDRSLELAPNNKVFDNKARMLLSWSRQLVEESKMVPNGLNTLKKAREIIQKAIDTIPSQSEENIEKYIDQRDSVDFYIGYEKEYQRRIEILKGFDKSELFTITGRYFYKSDVKLLPDMPLELVKEPDNKYDSKAIAVYAEGKKIGYVANNANTAHPLTALASTLCDKLPDVSKGYCLFYLDRYVDVQCYVGRIIK